MRIDKYLAGFYPQFSRKKLQTLIGAGLVEINGKKIDPDFDFHEGMSLSVSFPKDETSPTLAEDLPLKVVYENDDFLVIDKPVGLVVHPGSGHSSGTVVNALLGYLGKASTDDERFGIVHRLDKDTSGLMVLAKNKETTEKLKKVFHDREVHKEYLALVRGHLAAPAGEINRPLGRNSRGGLRFSVGVIGKQAITRYFSEKVYPKHTLLRIVPITGRTHQIRVHLKSVGHPIVGDSLYGGEEEKRLFLHAVLLSFRLDGRDYKYESALPKHLKNFLQLINERG
jgi:23S rRNA pseudouridine1911/1915/1917 synthase